MKKTNSAQGGAQGSQCVALGSGILNGLGKRRSLQKKDETAPLFVFLMFHFSLVVVVGCWLFVVCCFLLLSPVFWLTKTVEELGT